MTDPTPRESVGALLDWLQRFAICSAFDTPAEEINRALRILAALRESIEGLQCQAAALAEIRPTRKRMAEIDRTNFVECDRETLQEIAWELYGVVASLPNEAVPK